MTRTFWLLVGGILCVGAAFSTSAALSQESDSTLCGGQDADIVVSSDQMFAAGTEADERVVLPDGVGYASGGGTDIVCNSKGEVEATLLSDGEGPAKPDSSVADVNLVTTEEMANGELPGEWNPNEGVSDGK